MVRLSKGSTFQRSCQRSGPPRIFLRYWDTKMGRLVSRVVSSYVKIGVGFGGWRWVQMRSEIRLLRTRMASLWVFPRVMSFW